MCRCFIRLSSPFITYPPLTNTSANHRRNSDWLPVKGSSVIPADEAGFVTCTPLTVTGTVVADDAETEAEFVTDGFGVGAFVVAHSGLVGSS